MLDGDKNKYENLSNDLKRIKNELQVNKLKAAPWSNYLDYLHSNEI